MVAAAKKLLLSGAAGVCRRISGSIYVQTLLFNALRLDRQETRSIVLDESIRFSCYCLSRRDWSRSQILQDLWVCYELGEKTHGFFVEFGATNGYKNSNTWLLETKLGWSGILAEPNPVWHSDLRRNRTASIETRCVSAKSGDLVAFITTDDTDPELSGIASFSDADHFTETRSRGRRINLETISLDDLLAKYAAPKSIDYLSIDTEGSELDILSSYSFSHTFKTISVENNPKNEKAVDNLLAEQGYRRVFRQFSQWDSWYVSADHGTRGPVAIIAPDA